MTSEIQTKSIIDSVMQSPFFPAKIYPTAGGNLSYAVPVNRNASRPKDGQYPLPSERWLQDWGGAAAFLHGGERDMKILRDVATQIDFTFPAGSRVLEFGVSRGRLVRWLYDVADRSEIWGVDVVAEDIEWCQQNLGSPFKFFTNTSYPYLPFEDNTFDFIYAGSVFTHISDLADAWLLELKRITKVGGHLYLTVHDNHSIKVLYDRGHVKNNPWWTNVMAEFDRVTGNKPISEFETVVLLRGGPSMEQVFYDREYLIGHWTPYLKLVTIREEAYSAFQTAFVMQKTDR